MAPAMNPLMPPRKAFLPARANVFRKLIRGVPAVVVDVAVVPTIVVVLTKEEGNAMSVSYTHLTLPTKRIV